MPGSSKLHFASTGLVKLFISGPASRIMLIENSAMWPSDQGYLQVLRNEKTAKSRLNPFTPESDQCQISPAPSPEILHHTVWRTWLFITYSNGRWLHYRISLPHSYIFSLKCWENVLFELWTERVNSGLAQCGFEKPDPGFSQLDQKYKRTNKQTKTKQKSKRKQTNPIHLLLY